MRRFVLVTGALVVALSSWQARGSLVRGFTLEQLGREAESVVLGRVTRSESFWNESREKIYTHHHIRVERTFKGPAGDLVTVRQMGGTVGDTTLTIAGDARLAPDERVLLVLRNHDGFSTLVGMAQGKWTVRRMEGLDHAFRGPPPDDTTRPESGLPLAELLEKMGLSPNPQNNPEEKHD